MSYKPLSEADKKIWKEMFQKGDSFKKIEEFFANRKDSPFDFNDLVKGMNEKDKDVDNAMDDFLNGFGSKKKPKKK